MGGGHALNRCGKEIKQGLGMLPPNQAGQRHQYEAGGSTRKACGGHPTDARLSSSTHPPNCFFTTSLTVLPSTRAPVACSLAMAFFMTVPMSFIVGDPISAMVAFTTAAISSSPMALGR